MPSFVDVLCGHQGDFYANFNPLAEENKNLVTERAADRNLAKSFVALMRAIRKGDGAGGRYAEQLKDLQKTFAAKNKKMAGEDDPFNAVGLLIEALPDLKSMLEVTFANKLIERASSEEMKKALRENKGFDLATSFFMVNLGIKSDLSQPLLRVCILEHLPIEMIDTSYPGLNSSLNDFPIIEAGEYLLFFVEYRENVEIVYHFPEYIDLSSFSDPAFKNKVMKAEKTLQYELIGLSVYEGWAHYTAYIKDQYAQNGGWYHCDSLGDKIVPVVGSNAIFGSWKLSRTSRKPRLLVYRRMQDRSLENLVDALRMLS